MINFNKLIDTKFINYFQNKSSDLNNPIFSQFIEEMNKCVENFDLKTIPLDDLKTLISRFGYTSFYYSHIKDIMPYLDSLSDYELFLLLYFSSCRNALTYDESFYIQSIENGNIINILLEMKKRII